MNRLFLISTITCMHRNHVYYAIDTKYTSSYDRNASKTEKIG